MPNQKNYSNGFIIKCAIEFSEMSLETDIYRFIGEKLHELTHKIVIINSFLPESYHLKTEHIFGYKALALKIARGIGYNPLGKEYTIPPEVAQQIYSNEIIKVPCGLDELTFNKLSGRNARILEKVIRLNKIYVTGFTKGKDIYGSAIIIIRKNEILENHETLKLFSRLASIALQKRNLELSNKEINRRQNTLIENIHDMVCFKDQHGENIMINKAYAEFVGLKKEQIIGKKDEDIFLKPIAEKRQKSDKKAEISEEKQREEEIIVNKTGEKRHLDTIKAPILSENGKFEGVVSVSRDITELIARKHQIKKSEEEISKLNLAVEQSPSSILITDTKGIIEYVNPRFTEVTGYTKEEVTGKKPNILKSGRHGKEFYKNLWNTIINGREWRGEIENKKKSGEIFWELASITGIRNNEGTITQYLGIKEDITERKKAEQEIIAAKEKAENADKLKTAFLSNMSHEIRTPMNAIIGFSDLLKMGSLDHAKQNEFIDYIKSNGQILLQLIDDIIDVAKIESDNIRIEKINFDVNEMLAELYQSFKNNSSIVASEDIDFRLNIPVNENMIIHNDPIRFKQIFTNLINNAFKFTKSGYIEFGYKINKDDSLVFFVEDTGIGMSEQYQKQIFERFSQVDESNTREFGGAGLGLTISKNLAHLMGGDIWVKSKKGKGSVFMFTISSELEKARQSQPKKTIEKETVEKSWEGKKIMIVEDNEANYLFLKEILLEYECQIIWAKDAEETIEKFRENADCDLILMDIRLPGGKNGYDLTRQIKSNNPHIPVIAQTAYAMSKEKDNSIKAGCDDYLSKPIDINQLHKILKKYLN